MDHESATKAPTIAPPLRHQGAALCRCGIFRATCWRCRGAGEEGATHQQEEGGPPAGEGGGPPEGLGVGEGRGRAKGRPTGAGKGL